MSWGRFELLAQPRSDLIEVRKLVRSMRGLAVTAMDGTLSPVERARLDTRFQLHVFQLQQLALTSQSNAVHLLDGSNSFVELQIHPSQSQTWTLWLLDCTPLNLGLESQNVASAANAGGALVACYSALDSTASSLSSVRAAALALGF